VFMDVTQVAARLKDLARNFYWGWHPEVVAVFRDLDPELWRAVNHNPTTFLSRLAKNVLEEKGAEPVPVTRLTRALEQVRRYLETEDAWGLWHAGPLGVNPVAYFSAEFGLHESLPIYSGGLGILAGDHLKAASDLAVPMVGVGLYYAKGYFDQTVDVSGCQHERYLNVDISDLPLEPIADEYGHPVRVTVQMDSGDIQVRAWGTGVGRNRLVLLDTNVDGNSEQNRALTTALYSGDGDVRVRQQVILGVGGLRVLAAVGIRPGVIHLNEGHTAFAVLELTRYLMERDGQTFENMMELAASQTIFTVHTPLEASVDRYRPELIERVLEPLRQQLRISKQDLLALGRANPRDEHEPFCPTVLGLKMSRRRNGVSALHARVSRAMWRKVWPELPEQRVPINFITNGVHVATWLAQQKDQLYSRYLGKDWQEKSDDPRTWRRVTEINDAELWEIDQFLRNHLIEYVRRNAFAQAKARRDSEEICKAASNCLGPSVLTIGFARRFTTYKRGDFLLRDLTWLDHIVNHPERPVQFVIAGKAHPRDEPAKKILQQVFRGTRDRRFLGRIVFLENYDINVSRHLVQGVDLWLNIPRRPLEACGTSGQKVALNGGLNLSVLDGWWAEAYDGTNGFAIGYGSEHSNWERQDHLDTQSFHEVMENKVIPLFYDRGTDGIPHGWVAMQKRSLRTLAWRYNARRMLLDYTMGYYLPAAGGVTASLPVGSPDLAIV
jgi:starch phosphorylase